MTNAELKCESVMWQQKCQNIFKIFPGMRILRWSKHNFCWIIFSRLNGWQVKNCSLLTKYTLRLRMKKQVSVLPLLFSKYTGQMIPASCTYIFNVNWNTMCGHLSMHNLHQEGINKAQQKNPFQIPILPGKQILLSIWLHFTVNCSGHSRVRRERVHGEGKEGRRGRREGEPPSLAETMVLSCLTPTLPS